MSISGFTTRNDDKIVKKYRLCFCVEIMLLQFSNFLVIANLVYISPRCHQHQAIFILIKVAIFYIYNEENLLKCPCLKDWHSVSSHQSHKLLAVGWKKKELAYC
jgi:hypothetical protein